MRVQCLIVTFPYNVHWSRSRTIEMSVINRVLDFALKNANYRSIHRYRAVWLGIASSLVFESSRTGTKDPRLHSSVVTMFTVGSFLPLEFNEQFHQGIRCFGDTTLNLLTTVSVPIHFSRLFIDGLCVSIPLLWLANQFVVFTSQHVVIDEHNSEKVSI